MTQEEPKSLELTASDKKKNNKKTKQKQMCEFSH